MIIVDTNVWSEALRASPNPGVLAWLRAHANEAILTAVSVFELRHGVGRMPQGARRRHLETQIDQMITNSAARTLSYDATAASEHARFAAAAGADGRALSREDGQLLGIAAVHGCAIATRNVRDFEGFGIRIINPWSEQADPISGA